MLLSRKIFKKIIISIIKKGVCMKSLALICFVTILMALFPGSANSQTAGDFRTHQSGSWHDANTWEQYNGSTWVWPAISIPDTLHFTTIRNGHTVAVTLLDTTYVGASTIESGGNLNVGVAGDSTVILALANGTMTVYGTLTQTGKAAINWYTIDITSTGSLVIGNGGVFKQDQSGKNGGTLPRALWNDGSTLMVTGIDSATSMGGRPDSYYNIVWNCPNQKVNANMGFHPPTGTLDTTTYVRGDIQIISTGLARAYLCGPNAGTESERNVTRVIVEGDINVSNGSIFSSNGTSKGYTDIFVTVLGNIAVRDSGSQLSISRGSQGGTGRSIWYIKSDSVYYDRKTTNQNSTDPNTGTTMNGRFIFCKEGTQYVTLDDSIAWSGKCNMQFGDSVTTSIINIGNSPFGGSACHQRIKRNATVIVGPNGYIGGGTNNNSIPSDFAMDEGATLVIASQSGIRATGMGSSGAVRVSGNRDYGNNSNFEYNGSEHQRLGSGFPASANNLTINNPEGVYVDSVSAFTINGTLSVQNGDLDLNGCTITLGPSGLLNETAGNTVKGDEGVITTTRTLTSPSSSINIAGLGVQIGSTANLGSTVITRGHAVQGTTSVKRYFDIVPANNTGLNATLIYRYDASELNGLDPGTMLLWRSEDGGSSWNNQPASNNAVQYTLTATGLNSLSRWCASDLAHPLDADIARISVNQNWNMISLPCLVADPRKTMLFPTATSDAFAYENQYIVKDSLQIGIAYWLKFPEAGTVLVPGVSVLTDTIPVVEGWNMIGSISEPIYVYNVMSDPPGIVTSQFFTYEGTYITADSIKPGKGYWIKASQSGKVILDASSSANPKNVIKIVEGSELPPPPPVEIESQIGKPLEYHLGQIYPNPFNPSTSFTIAVPEPAYLEVAIYDVLGKKVRTLLSEEKPAGYYTIEWNGITDENRSASSGIYFVRVMSGKFNAIEKIVLMK